ncbi:MAG TPA: serine kinase [Cyanobacteria bacterium UBA8530]|nr:serine kinase [Cyanobacteria bacterium UBA8530]
MRLEEIRQALDLEVAAGEERLDTEVSSGYASDLLSDVLAHGLPGALWVTRQTHANIVAVALMKKLAGILLVHGEKPQEDTLLKAREEHVPVLCSQMPSFEVIGRMYGLGLGSGQVNAQTAQK